MKTFLASLHSFLPKKSNSSTTCCSDSEDGRVPLYKSLPPIKTTIMLNLSLMGRNCRAWAMRAPGMEKMLKLGNSMFRACESARSKFFEEEVLRVWTSKHQSHPSKLGMTGLRTRWCWKGFLFLAQRIWNWMIWRREKAIYLISLSQQFFCRLRDFLRSPNC